MTGVIGTKGCKRRVANIPLSSNYPLHQLPTDLTFRLLQRSGTSSNSHSHHRSIPSRHLVNLAHPLSAPLLAFIMALFGLFGGAAPQQPAQEQPKEHTTSADLFASTNFSQSQSQPQPQPGSSFIPDPPAAGPSTQAPAPQLPSALDTFSSAYDPAKLHPLAGLGQNLDFLQLDEDKLTDMEGAASVLPSRGWTDDLCVGTGTTYVSGKCHDGRGLSESYVPARHLTLHCAILPE